MSEYCKNCYELAEQLHSYKQVVKEIKEISYKNLQTNLCSNCDGVGLYEGCEDTECSYYQMDKIIQKCEEVNNDK